MRPSPVGLSVKQRGEGKTAARAVAKGDLRGADGTIIITGVAVVKISVVEQLATGIAVPLLAVGVFEGAAPDGAAAVVDAALGAMLSQLIADREIRGKLNEITIIHTGGRIGAKRVAVLGLGTQADFSLDRLRQATGTIAKRAGHLKLSQFAIAPSGASTTGLSTEAAARAIVEGAALGSYEYRRFKTQTAELPAALDELILVDSDWANTAALREGARVGDISARATTLARDLSNGPANLVTPSYLAEQARAVAAQFGLQFDAWGPAELRQRGFGTLLAVSEGSAEEPRLITLRHQGRPGGKTLAIVGKGITFDSGGISIKPSEGMWYMKHDMSGAATVIGFLQGVAELKLGVNVIGIIPASENMPSGKAVKPGDVVVSYSGKTIEIQNTDAEGRLVLADGLAFAAEQKPQAIIDLATLTGACVVALGTMASGAFSNDEALLKQVEAAAERSGERVWRLPIWEEYGQELKSDVADLKNIGAGRHGGAILGASFLSNFVADVPWVHLDIAGTAWAEKELPYVPKGASGVGVRLLLDLVQQWQ